MKNISIMLFSLLTFMLSVSISAQVDEESTEDYVDNGDFKSAQIVSDKMVMEHPDSAVLWFKNGKIYQNLLKFNKAILSYNEAIKLDSEILKYKFALAKAYQLSGQVNEAIKVYEKVLATESDNIGALNNLAAIYLGKKNTSKAYPLYYKLANLDTTNAEYIRKMARCREIDKDWTEMIGLLEQAYIKDSTNLMVVLDLSRIYIRTEKNDTAISILNKAIRLYPNSGRLYSRRGNANFGKNYHYRAIPDFIKATELNAGSALINKRLGISKFMTKKYEEARDILEELIVKDTSDYQICMYLGNTYNALFKYDKGLLFFNKAIENLSADPLVMSSIYNSMSKSFEGKGLYEKQISMVQKREGALTKEYKSPYYLYEIARIYEKNVKNKRKAVEYYEKYYAEIKNVKWYSETSEEILAKINRLKEDLHFER